MAFKGSCLCGGVAFEIDEACGPFEICHCSRCRKISGSIGLPGIMVKAKHFRMLRGEALIKRYEAPILYRPPAYASTFCSVCGSIVPLLEAGAEDIEIPAGLFDDDPGIRPDKHIFVELLPAWDRISDDLPTFTLPELYKLRTGKELPADFKKKS